MNRSNKQRRGSSNGHKDKFQSLLKQIQSIGDRKLQIQRAKSFKQLILEQWKTGFLKPILLWIIWILMGTTFYALYDYNGNFSHGFYFAVNIGYCIGWCVLFEKDEVSYMFSIIYIFVGASTISGWLAYLIESTLNSVEDWHHRLHVEENLRKRLVNASYSEQFLTYFQENTYQFYIVLLWCCFILFGTVWSCGVIGWDPIQGLYFAFSSLSTGGNHGIPLDSPDYVFFIVGLWASLGVPVMGLAMGSIAASVVSTNQNKKTLAIIYSPISGNEEKVFSELQINANEKYLNKDEFLLLVLLRLGAVDTQLIKQIYERFNELDTDELGEISYRDLLEIKRRNSIAMNPMLASTAAAE